MCGIHLIVAKKSTSHPAHSALHRMMRVSTHRGPDATHTLHWLGNQRQVFLGGQRLKITDLNDRASQPMISADERYALLYNGALYNFPELRNKLLGRGEIFSTHSDTEVVLKMLIWQGEAALAQLEGMFALAFYDRKEERLLLARDPSGIKPLYYAENDSFLLVSSSSQSIVASGLISTEVDPLQIDHYFCFRYPEKGRTLYRGIYPLKEGNYLTSTPSITTERKSFTFFTEDDSDPAPKEPKVQERVEELLKDALLRHLTADVPSGLFLSGGVDSTLLLALMKAVGVPPVPTFSIVNNIREKNFGTHDYRYARQAAQQYGSYHREVPLTLSLFEKNFENFIQHLDQPIGDSGAMMTYLLSQEASQHVKVVLSGAGADELFGGYNRHQAYYRYLKYYPWFKWLSKPSKKAASVLPTGFNHPLRKPFRLFTKFAHSLSDNPRATFLQFVTLSQLRDCSQSWLENDCSSEGNFVEDHLSFALQHDQRHYLTEDVLQMSDVNSMAHGLELRVPYLDAPLMRYVQSLPAVFQLKNGPKWILRDLLNRYGGKPFTRRPKEGFGLPFGYWLQEGQSTVIRQHLEDAQLPVYGFISFKQVNQLLTSHRKGYHDYSAELWTVLLLSAWLSRQDF